MHRIKSKINVSIVFIHLLMACAQIENSDNEDIGSFIIQSDAPLNSNIESIEKDFSSNLDFYQAGTVRFFHNINDFDSFYQGLKTNATNIETPHVDFSQFRIIVAVDKVRSSAGYSVEIISVEKKDESTYVTNVQYISPKKDDVVATVLTKPYHIIKIPLK